MQKQKKSCKYLLQMLFWMAAHPLHFIFVFNKHVTVSVMDDLVVLKKTALERLPLDHIAL